MNAPHRATVFLEDARIIAQDAHPGEQFVLRLAATKLAAAARPGQFAHLACDPQLPMRRPMSLMRVDPNEGWAEFLYKRVGHGTRLLSAKSPGESISVLGPIGRPFHTGPERPRPLLIGGGVGIPPMIFLADGLRRVGAFQPMVIMGSEVPFPFQPRPSAILVPGMPAGVMACSPLLEDWGVASRLASLQGYPGCYEGYVTGLARCWLDALPEETRRTEVEILACGPTPMLRACVELAADMDLPCQVCVEEYMACAVGGCAGCVVRVRGEDGDAMRRVCVDGPVFDGHAVVWG